MCKHDIITILKYSTYLSYSTVTIYWLNILPLLLHFLMVDFLDSNLHQIFMIGKGTFTKTFAW